MDEQYLLSRRERKKRDCKYTILHVARDLMMERGTDVPIEEIANRADISYPTFYNYFPAKSELYYALYLEEIEDLREFIELELKEELTVQERLRRLMEAVMHDFVRYRYLDLYIAGEVARRTGGKGNQEQIYLLFEQEIRRGIESGEFDEKLDVRRHALLMTGIVLSASFYGCPSEDYLGMLDSLFVGMSKPR